LGSFVLSLCSRLSSLVFGRVGGNGRSRSNGGPRLGPQPEMARVQRGSCRRILARRWLELTWLHVCGWTHTCCWFECVRPHACCRILTCGWFCASGPRLRHLTSSWLECRLLCACWWALTGSWLERSLSQSAAGAPGAADTSADGPLSVAGPCLQPVREQWSRLADGPARVAGLGASGSTLAAGSPLAAGSCVAGSTLLLGLAAGSLQLGPRWLLDPHRWVALAAGP
jgi:hypothetical protein